MRRMYDNLIKLHFADDGEMLFFTGPRQVGKTTASKSIAGDVANFEYLNWDNDQHRMLILKGIQSVASATNLESLTQDKVTIVFDEIHKFSDWKQFLKGFFDTYNDRVNIIVTGSAKLDTYKKGGDSLMGRYFSYQMHPLSVGELIRQTVPEQEISKPAELDDKVLQQLYQYGGFPQPFIKGSITFHNKWQRTKKQQLFYEDVRDLNRVTELAKMELLGELLRYQVAEHLNYAKLAAKVGVAHDTINRWIEILKSLYYCYTIKPFSKNIARSLLKEPKVYLWDWSLIKDKGARAENFIASHLLKAVQTWTDLGFGEYELFYIRTIDKEEVDFLVTQDGQPWMLVEVKSSDNRSISKALYKYQQQTKAKYAFQVVLDMPYIDKNCFEFTRPMIVPAVTFLSQLV